MHFLLTWKKHNRINKDLQAQPHMCDRNNPHNPGNSHNETRTHGMLGDTAQQTCPNATERIALLYSCFFHKKVY